MLKEGIKENTKGDDTKIIDDEAFRGCVNLEKVNIPSCVGRHRDDGFCQKRDQRNSNPGQCLIY